MASLLSFMKEIPVSLNIHIPYRITTMQAGMTHPITANKMTGILLRCSVTTEKYSKQKGSPPIERCFCFITNGKDTPMAIVPVKMTPHILVFFETCRFIGITMILENEKDGMRVATVVRCNKESGR